MIDPYMPVAAKTDEHGTPKEFFEIYNKRYHFDIDLAASKENTKCLLFYSKEDNALTKQWRGSCWLNPPYDHKSLKAFVDKTLEQRPNYRWCVMLLPCKTDQSWWHKLWNSTTGDWIKIEWVKGRIKFDGNKNSAPSPNVVVIIKGCG